MLVVAATTPRVATTDTTFTPFASRGAEAEAPSAVAAGVTEAGSIVENVNVSCNGSLTACTGTPSLHPSSSGVYA
jgi:hypothetical protein